jgi:hypothetical protein
MNGKYNKPDNDGITSEQLSPINQFRSEFSAEMQQSLGEASYSNQKDDLDEADEDGIQ